MRGVVALAAGLMAAGGAMAQQTTLEPAAALGCLSPPAAMRGAPAYPFDEFKGERNGRVVVRLQFSKPDQPPAMELLAHEGGPAFVDAVRAHVATLRVPCQDAAGPPSALDFDFSFRAGDPQPVAPVVPSDPAAAERQRQVACLTRQEGGITPGYPGKALREGVQGRVLLELRFDAPDRPPLVRVMPRVGGDSVDAGRHPTRVFVEPLRAWASGYRLPCLAAGPLTIVQAYVYVIEGSHYGFKPGMDLRGLLPLVQGVRAQRLQIDTRPMGCPFDLTVHYRQPNLPNLVRVLDRPARETWVARALLFDWLAQLRLDLPDSALDAVYGDTLHLTVPCLNIDLNPTGVTS